MRAGRPFIDILICFTHNIKTVNFTILVIDDEHEVCLSLCEILSSRGFETKFETDPTRTLDILKSTSIDLVLIDIRMPKVGGIDLLKTIKKEYPMISVIMISGHATVDNAVLAMKYGAVNLFTKPIDMKELLSEINQIKNASQNRRISINENDDEIITQNPEMKKILYLVEKAAPTDATVLLTGETGTGKELIAKKLHSLSKRAGKPYIRINCAAIPETLLESEMFGHEAGAFTDAKTMKQGIFEVASEGTILLDEIGDMSARTQAKMLRILQERQFSRVGSTVLLHTNCRVIAATNKNLAEEIRKGNFREDFYYRLNVIHLHLPSLKERREDILLLMRYFLTYYCELYSKCIDNVSGQVESLLLKHQWPGNIRELKNFVERAVIFSTGTSIDISELPDQYRYITSREEPDLSEQYDEKAREVILRALQMSKGRKLKAARILKIDRKTLYNRIKKLNIL